MSRNDFGSGSFTSLARALDAMGEDYADAADAAPDLFDKHLRVAAESLQGLVEYHAPRSDPDDREPGDSSEHLEDTVSVRKRPGTDHEYEVHVGADYAAPVHEGSKPHEITPKRADALHFYINGREVFATRVEHPGNDPNPFLERAVDEFRPEMVQYLRAVIDDLRREHLSNTYRVR